MKKSRKINLDNNFTSQEYNNTPNSTYFDNLANLQTWYTAITGRNSSYNFDLDKSKIATESLSSYTRSTKEDSSNSHSPQIPGSIQEKRTKLLVCHDLKGGYQPNEDDSPNGYFPHPNGTRYFLQYPQFIDTFVYFSHHRVSVPPVNWINLCHKNGIKCLGTIIFEGNASTDYEELDKLLKVDSNGNFLFVDILVKLVAYFGFDGFLLNIETKFSNEKISDMLLPFIDILKAKLHVSNNRNELIWYDSYLYPSNKVYYMNGVTDLNVNFYNLTDSILTNYWWTIKNLQENIKNVGILGVQNKIFVGYDVWGRGALVGKGGFDSSLACQMIKKYKSNVALFAPAWTYEYLGAKQFIENDTRFWIGLFESEFSIASSIEPFNNSVYKINDSSFMFYTSFNVGEGYKFFESGEQVYDKNWVNGSLQSEIPLFVNRKDKNGLQFNINKFDSFNGGSCLEIKYNELVENGGYQIFNDQTIKNITLFNFKQDCHFHTMGVKITYKLNHKTKSIFKLKVKYYVERRFRSVTKLRTGYLTIPLFTTSGKWFTIDETFTINLQNSREYIVLESVELSYDDSDTSATDNFYRSYVMEDSVITSVMDNEEYEKLINSELYQGDEDEDWILIPSDFSIGSDENGKRPFPFGGYGKQTQTTTGASPSSASSSALLLRKDLEDKSTKQIPVLKIGELSITNANNYPSDDFFTIPVVKSKQIEYTHLRNESKILLSWCSANEGNIKELLYYLVFVNDEFKGTSNCSTFLINDLGYFDNTDDDEKKKKNRIKNVARSVGGFKVRIDGVDRLGRVTKGDEIQF